MIDDKPLVSVGVPAYNEEKYIRKTLTSLLSQDYPRFEIIVSDNASTDATEKICIEMQAKDPRIHYYRNETNIGSVNNYNRTFELSQGQYFMWAGGHDMWDKSFISKCASRLGAAPDVVLIYAQTMVIDENEKELGMMPDKIDTRGMSPAKRYRRLVWNLRQGNMIYGMFRRDAFEKTHRYRSGYGADGILLAELSLLGEFEQIKEVLFFRRANRANYFAETPLDRLQRHTQDANPSGKKGNSYFSMVKKAWLLHIDIVKHARISFFDKILCHLMILPCFIARLMLRWPILAGAVKKMFRATLPES